MKEGERSGIQVRPCAHSKLFTSLVVKLNVNGDVGLNGPTFELLLSGE